MSLELSEFGEQLGVGSGISELMDDLGNALAIAATSPGNERVCMLGGGQPAHIAEMDAVWRQRTEAILAKPGLLEHTLGHYEPPVGNTPFRTAMANLLRRQYDWDLSADNIAVTAGGQTAFFLLFNALAGKFRDGRRKKILLPLVPEYIGYANQSVNAERGPGDGLFRAIKPRIEITGKHEFKYRVDFDALEVTDDIAAICVSRPTNPTGNVLTDAEIDRLSRLAHQHRIPLIIDNAYGAPFPNAIFSETRLIWNDNTILTLSLSKIGLPGTRTGIVVANTEIIQSLSSMMSIVGLANNNFGQALVTPLIESGEVLRLSNEVVQPFYREKSRLAQQWAHEFFDDSLPYFLHRSEGAFFLWMWFKDLPISSQELYQRLKRRNVLVVPGNYFFFGMDHSDWKHASECLRVTFTMPDGDVKTGYKIIAEEVARAYREN
ncbi:Valine--pyruvate aminotransferase [Novipirellula aureliae]|uniref:Valine--pyruvate aminotransferase n=1 Tax=Novipirellula aureliae TaxID=2527966 RepID=A0A5C6DKD7_9BACT|nr:valine--pyruvate transaminase [Novipirellula aureliae]TWU37823.1 Valine--pyruvate aminotransferase [Novipirellula aureliae]